MASSCVRTTSPSASRRRSSSTSCSTKRSPSAGSRSATCAMRSRTTISRWPICGPVSSRAVTSCFAATSSSRISLDGVYRRGEIYLRFLQKLSSILFGTRVGRFLSKYLLVPRGRLVRRARGTPAHRRADRRARVQSRGAEDRRPAGVHHGRRDPVPVASRSAVARRAVGRDQGAVRHGLRIVLIDVPRAILRTSVMRRFFAGPIWRLGRSSPRSPLASRSCCWATNSNGRSRRASSCWSRSSDNSRYGRMLEEFAADWSVRSGRYFIRRLLPGLGTWLLDIFSELIELFDRAIYRVDEWLRFRVGQSVVYARHQGRGRHDLVHRHVLPAALRQPVHRAGGQPDQALPDGDGRGEADAAVLAADDPRAARAPEERGRQERSPVDSPRSPCS